MPPTKTLRDVAMLLDKLRKLIVLPSVAKSDIQFRVEISRHLESLKSMDIEAIAIDTHSMGHVGNVQANIVRNHCAEILSRIQTFFSVYSDLDKEDKLKNAEIDEYDITHLFDAVMRFESKLNLYKSCLISAGKIPLPENREFRKESLEIGRYMLEEAREDWLKGKRKFLKELQDSLEFDQYIARPKEKLYQNLCYLSQSIYDTMERYFPPCEIKLTLKLRETFVKRFQKENGSYASLPAEPQIGKKVSENMVKRDASDYLGKEAETKREWDIELFPMILISELYEVCSDVFDSTETQFHSSLNLHCKHEPIRIRPKQKIKACYLISKLYEIVPSKHKAAWREDILSHLDIQWSYYEKKYCHPRGDDASVSSREYADEIDKIFKNHKKRA